MLVGWCTSGEYIGKVFRKCLTELQSMVPYIWLCENDLKMQAFLIGNIYCGFRMVIHQPINSIRVFGCASTSECDLNYSLAVYCRFNRNWCHERILDIHWVKYIEYVSQLHLKLAISPRLSFNRSSRAFLPSSGEMKTIWAISSWIVSEDMALQFQAKLKNMEQSISLLSIEVEAHLRSTVQLSLMVLDLTLQTYSIQLSHFHKQPVILNIWFQCRHASELCLPTLHYPWTIHSALFQAYCLPSWMLLNLWLPAYTDFHLSDIQLLGADC